VYYTGDYEYRIYLCYVDSPGVWHNILTLFMYMLEQKLYITVTASDQFYGI